MIINNLLIKLKDSSPGSIAKTSEVLLGMRERIEYIRDLKVEVDVRSGPYDLMLIVQYASMADMEAYLVPSKALLVKLGFQQEGLLRNYMVQDGKPHDTTVYSIVK